MFQKIKPYLVFILVAVVLVIAMKMIDSHYRWCQWVDSNTKTWEKVYSDSLIQQKAIELIRQQQAQQQQQQRQMMQGVPAPAIPKPTPERPTEKK